MNCDSARKLLPLAYYGELSFDEEDRLEQHLESCVACREERELIAAMQSALDEDQARVPAELLSRCRRELGARLEEERRHPWRAASLIRLWQFLSNPPAILKPAGALAMLAIGFGLARWQPANLAFSRAMGSRDAEAAVVQRVRFVDPDSAGRVRVAFDEVRTRELTGGLADNDIRRLLLAGAADQADPGVRVESIEALKAHTSDEVVRRALLNALRGDTNAGVRLKALEGLKPYARDAETRRALCHVLLTDENAGIRTTAIDLLVQNHEPEVAGVLQELVRRESNSYVRDRSQKALTAMKASVGTF